MYGRVLTAWLLLSAMTLAAPQIVAAQSDYHLEADDVLSITVGDHADLTRKTVVDPDGTILFPLLGRVPAAGLTVNALQEELRRRLAAGFLVDPQVRVQLERTMRVFVFGGVTSPGMYPLTDDMTLIEVLARAGYGGAAEALIVRNQDSRAPTLPRTGTTSDVIRVNLREFEKDLQEGKLSRNVVLNDGDTIYVPRLDPNRIYVSGQVRTPGAYSVPEGTTLLQALALAGGPTERAALGRIKVLRLKDAKQESVSVNLEDVVRPGDTILVPERYF